MLKIMALFLLTSCSLFQTRPSLKNQDTEKLLNAVKLTGEGTGRLSLGQSKYVFGFESVLQENHDWILAVSIPLHGEEVMILQDLKQSQIQDPETESFEERIEKEFQRLKLNKKLTSAQFMKEFRSLIRFNLSPAWGKKRNCEAQQSEFVCDLEGEKFTVLVEEKELKITKSLGEKKKLQLVAKNLTESFFEQTDIKLLLDDTEIQKNESPFSLELFWKN